MAKQAAQKQENLSVRAKPATGPVVDKPVAEIVEKLEKAKEEKPKIDPKEAAIEHAKTLVPVQPTSNLGERIKLVPFSEKNIQEFGNSFVFGLVAAAGLEAEARAALGASDQAKQYLGFEMARAIFALAVTPSANDQIDVYNVFGDAKAVEKLNNRTLLRLGVLKREVTDDTVKYLWTDKQVEDLYMYNKDLKDKDAEEYEKRFNNRKRLNMRLSEAYKTVAVLLDNKLTPDDLYYSEDKETQSLVPTIRNAPKEIGGVAGTVQLGSRKPVTGADLSPTMASIVNLANKRHKEPKADRADKGENREGVAKMGMDDEAFGGIINTLRRAISTQEGVFSVEMQKQLKALASFINPLVEEMD